MTTEALETLAFHISHLQKYGYANSSKWYNHWMSRAAEDGVNVKLLEESVKVALESYYAPSFKMAVKAYMILDGSGIDLDA